MRTTFLKHFLLIPFLLLLFFLEASFLPHFKISGAGLNLVFIAVLFISFFAEQKSRTGILAGLWGGLLLDFASPLPFGFFVLLLGLLAFFIQRANLLFYQTTVFSFLLVFFFSFFFYKLPFLFLSFGWAVLFFEFLYNLAAAFIIFLTFKLFKREQ